MTKPSANRPARQSHLQWVKLDDLHINPVAQREFKPAWAQFILNDFDIDKFQVPHVNERIDGSLWIMEGQHGTWAYRQWLGGDNEQIQVWIYKGLTEQEEAEFFLSLNNKKAIELLDRFKVAVTAGREVECDIDRIVRANGCVVSGSPSTHGSISAVGALTTIYNRFGGVTLSATLNAIGNAFGDGGFERPNLIGLAMVLARYPDVDRVLLIAKLAKLRNGSKGLVQKAYMIREQMGCSATDATAAAVVDIHNAGRGGRKLPSWWKSEDAA